ncbi:HDOD domain-containing protein [Leeia sp. TBRC 13508]|uniref:HDOD domain-containing protein n=1 Tax=Leeia speluncae TaxID=2884804 RepID=A0ABS8D4Y4_9NEIS|nr:serine/threonine protein kinase [Leeia speluncae]MCB6183231.1 HDOD domain-containing protein [Leeia speluncae]
MADKIGRFELVKPLGQGAQGRVWLANDPMLGRMVAIKELLTKGTDTRHREALLGEARIVSQLQHPSIVQLFDVVEHDKGHVLVFEYVEGQSLKDWMDANGAMEPVKAAGVIAEILSGLGAAHEKGILHRDIKPANVMLDANGHARLMDFGIAVPANQSNTSAASGTVQYMAPEYVSGRPAAINADIFSVGVLGYELMTGRNPFEGSNTFEVLNRIANVAVVPPSQVLAAVPERMDHILMVALNKNATERYASANDMQTALQSFLTPGENGAETAAYSPTLEFLLRRLKHSQDFPALSQSITSINKLVAADAESIHRLAETILHDFSLTNKLLRLVNSAVYGQFGGTISTISRAVLILGFDTVRNLAISLIVFEHLQNRQQATNLKDLIVGSFLSGLLARKAAKKVGLRTGEESFICGMFYHMGKLLAAYYLNEEYQEIVKRMQQGQTEQQAAMQVLGVDFSELGLCVSKEWRFPDKLIKAMTPFKDSVPTPRGDAEQIRLAANYAGGLSQIAMFAGITDRDKSIAALHQQYSKHVPITESEHLEFLKEGLNALLDEAHFFGVDVGRGGFVNKLKQFAGMPYQSAETKSGELGDTLEQAAQAFLNAEVDTVTQDTIDTEGVLTAGVQDITNTLVSDYKLNDLINMILETMYRGVGFRRVLFCMKDVRAGKLVARFGYGADIPEMKQYFSVPLDGVHDVFQLSMSKNLDIQIDDVKTGSLSERVPQWFKTHVRAEAFVVLPVIIDKKAIGMFYGDQATANTLNLTAKSLTLLKTLRNQAVLGIRQKQP